MPSNVNRLSPSPHLSPALINDHVCDRSARSHLQDTWPVAAGVMMPRQKADVRTSRDGRDANRWWTRYCLVLVIVANFYYASWLRSNARVIDVALMMTSHERDRVTRRNRGTGRRKSRGSERAAMGLVVVLVSNPALVLAAIRVLILVRSLSIQPGSRERPVGLGNCLIWKVSSWTPG